MRLGWGRPGSLALRRVLTNRMREYFTYGSVGGAGGNPGSYPAANPARASRVQSVRPVRRVAELGSLDLLARMSDEAPKKQTSPKLKRVDGPPKPPTRVTLDL